MADTCPPHNFVARRWKGSNPDAPRRCVKCGVEEVLQGRTAMIEVARLSMADAGRLGPAMRACTAMQQRFVLAFLELGTGNAAEAARLAGYAVNSEGEQRQQWASASAGRTLLSDAKVQAALQEEGLGRLGGMAAKALKRLDEMLEKPDMVIGDDGVARVSIKPAEQLKAIEMTLNRAGMHSKSEQLIRVEQVSDADKIARIKALAEQVGLDPAKLLGKAGVTIDAEFREVKKP